MLLRRRPKDRSRHTSQKESGNILIFILITVVLLAYLTRMVTSSSEQQSDVVTRQTSDDEINRMLTQDAALTGAIHQMLVNGEDPATLYTNLSTLKPGDAGFDTAPHNLKIYHPLGGGIQYMASSIPGNSAAIATAFAINKGAIVQGVGATDAVIGDVIFTAKISNATQCARINTMQLGSSTVPDMNATVFDDLFTNVVTTTVNAAACASCVNAPRMCVKKNGANEWGYYDAMLPG